MNPLDLFSLVAGISGVFSLLFVGLYWLKMNHKTYKKKYAKVEVKSGGVYRQRSHKMNVSPKKASARSSSSFRSLR